MIVSLKADANPAEVLRALVSRGLWVSQVERSATGEPRHYVIASYSAATTAEELSSIDGVSGVTTAKVEHPRVAAQGASVDIGGVSVGGSTAKPAFMVGPCSVESEAHVREIAERLAPLGVAFLRGGAYKPRTSPYAFQGHGEVALGWLKRAAEATGMKVVTEALSEADVPAVAELADVVQVGSRNMQNYALLKAVGRSGRPVLLKRGMSATMDEWLHSGEYLLAGGSRGVIFCERGIRSFDDATRNLLDLGAVALLAHVHKLPVIVDPSHGAGRRDLIVPLGRAALAAGAAGLMIETHADPATALSDGPQAIPLNEITAVMRELRSAVPRVVPNPSPNGGAS